MLPMAGLTRRSVFPTAMAAAAVPGTPLTEPAAVPRRICRKPTASACITVSRLTRMAEKHMTKPQAHVVVLCTLMLASCLMLAQQNAPNTQGITPPPGSPTPTPARMTFFVTSKGLGKGGDLGGLAGADAHCQALDKAEGAGDYAWRDDLSPRATKTEPAVNARDRIGNGPWYNGLGLLVAANSAQLHSAESGINKETAVTERGDSVNGVGDQPNVHDILTGSRPDGTAFVGNEDLTCGNWTSSRQGRAQVGHHDRMGQGEGASSWYSAHASSGCSQRELQSTGGAGLFYCFAID